MLLAEALQQITTQFHNNSMSDPGREAQELVLQSLNLSLTVLMMQKTKELSAEQEKTLFAFAQRRASGEPLAYIVGFKDFYKSRFFVNPNVLIPRSETELIVELALEQPKVLRIADLGCGSGCIGLSILREWPQAKLTGIDVSAEALAVAQKNAQQMQLESRVEWICKDVSQVELLEKVNLIIANPPYIDPSDVRIEPNVKKYEPHTALFADENGLRFYRQWTHWAARTLSEEGSLFYEVGQGQAAAVESICLQNGFKNIKIMKDLSNIERVVWARREFYG